MRRGDSRSVGVSSVCDSHNFLVLKVDFMIFSGFSW